MRRLSCLLLLLLGLSLSIHANNSHHPQEFLQSIQGSSHEGEQIVEHFCATCHAPDPQIELGAPKMGQKSDWDSRIKQGFAMLFKHTVEGIGPMPARGGCFECSDEQLNLAINSLLPKPLNK